MLIERIHLRNLLSFGPDSPAIELGPLNVFIGPNGSGKSNLLDALNLTRSTAGDLWGTVRAGGPVSDWIYKGPGSGHSARIDAVVLIGSKRIRYVLEFTQLGGRFEITEECIENAEADKGHSEPYLYYRFRAGRPVLNTLRGAAGSRTGRHQPARVHSCPA